MKRTITPSIDNKSNFQIRRNLSSKGPSDLTIRLILEFSKAYSKLPIEMHSMKGIILN